MSLVVVTITYSKGRTTERVNVITYKTIAGREIAAEKVARYRTKQPHDSRDH